MTSSSDYDCLPFEFISVLNQHVFLLQIISSDNPAPGLIRSGEDGSNVHAPIKWTELMRDKTKRAEASCALKRYIDGLFNPWDLQGLNSSIVATMTEE